MKKRIAFTGLMVLLACSSLFCQAPGPRTISKINAFIKEFENAHRFTNINEADEFIRLFSSAETEVPNDINDSRVKSMPVKEYVHWMVTNLCEKDETVIIRMGAPALMPSAQGDKIINFDVRVKKSIDYSDWHRMNDLVITVTEQPEGIRIQSIKTYRDYSRKEGPLNFLPSSVTLGVNGTVKLPGGQSGPGVTSHSSWINAHLTYPLMRLKLGALQVEPIIGLNLAMSRLSSSIADNTIVEVESQVDAENDPFAERIRFRREGDEDILYQSAQNSLMGMAGIDLKYFIGKKAGIYLNSMVSFELLTLGRSGSFNGILETSGHYRMEAGPWGEGFEYDISEPDYGFGTFADLTVDISKPIRKALYYNIEAGVSYSISEAITLSGGVGAYLRYRVPVTGYDRERLISGRFIDLAGITESGSLVSGEGETFAIITNSLNWFYPTFRVIFNF